MFNTFDILSDEAYEAQQKAKKAKLNESASIHPLSIVQENSEDPYNINTSEIARLNDAMRKSITKGMTGYNKLVMTQGFSSLGVVEKLYVFRAIENYSDFNDANDPNNEHDFGVINIPGNKLFWKIDYYDTNLSYGSPNPADPKVTARVLTVMLASEY